jgi:4-amino-4-deoxy-L-arabinose transferase-like glycosyltransferase
MKSETFSIAKYFPVLALLIFLSFFAHLGHLPLFDPDEGAYCEVTREMLANNNFTSVLLNGQQFFHKPPFFFWAQAVSIKFFGLTESALRLPSAIAALLLGASIFLFSRRFYDTRSAWHATLFMASSLSVTLIGRAASPEAIFCLFSTLTLFNIYRFYHTANKRHLYWVFMFAALGVLTKGAAALLIPVTASFIFFILKGKWKDFLRLLLNPIGLLVCGLIVVPWYLAEYIMQGEFVISDLFPLQQAETYPLNFIGDLLPIYSYPFLLLFGLLPYTGLFIKAVSRLRILMKNDLMQFMGIWFLASFVFALLFQPRSPFSMVYSLPPLFIIMSQVSDSMHHSFSLFIWPLLFTALLCLAPELAPYIAGSINNENARIVVTESLPYFDAFYRITLGAILLLLTALPFVKEAPSHTRFAILSLLFVGLVHFLVLPILGNTLQLPVKSAGLLTKKANLNVIPWKVHYPSFNVYAERQTERRPPQAGDIILTRLKNLSHKNGYETIFQKQNIALVKVLDIAAVK